MEPLERAIAELQEQNYGSAIRTLEMLTGRDPSNADAYKHLSTAYFRTGRREQAAEAAQRYVALRPTDPAGHYNAGVILTQLGQTAAAERAFRAALSADPSYAKAREALEKMAVSSAAATEATQPLPTAQPTVVPSFSQPTAAAAPTPATPAVPPAERKRGPMPLPAKIAAGGTVVASIAILLWLFLPGGPANPGRPKTAPRPSPSGITTPPPNSPTAEQPNDTGTPQPTPNPGAQPDADANTAPTPQPNPTQTTPSNPQPSAGSGPSTAAGRTVTQDQVAQALGPVRDEAVAQLGGLLDGTIRLFNDPRFNGENIPFWEIMQTAVATEGIKSMQTGPTPGELEIIQIIQSSPSGADAGRALSDRKAQIAWDSWLAFLQEAWNVLTQKDNAEDAYKAIKALEDKYGIHPSAATEKALQGNLWQLYGR